MVFFLEDPLTGDVPHRGLVEEEDEQRAAEVAPQYSATPEVQWSNAISVKEPTVVFLLGQAACLLLDAFFPHSQPAGTITVPELVRVRSPLEEEYGTRHQPVHTCTLHTLAAAAAAAAPAEAAAGSGPLLLVACPKELLPEQAGAWARSVLGALAPRRVLLAATLPAMYYRGPGSPANEDLVFSLLTQAAAAAAAAAAEGTSGGSGGSGSSGSSGSLPPPLPEATLVGGLPAALLSDCELARLPAALVVGVQQQQVPDAQFLYALGRGVQAALASLGAPATEEGEALEHSAVSKHRLLGALGAAADAVYRSSASSSIFT